MSKSRFIELMSKSLDKSASEQELIELEEFLRDVPRYKKVQQVTNALKTNLRRTGLELGEKEINSGLAEIWTKIKSADDSTKMIAAPAKIFSLSGYWKWISSAAAVVFLASVGLVIFNNYRHAGSLPAATNKVTINVPFGKSIQLTLPDGSKVKLNAGSHFVYPAAFAANLREVTLEGEGFFEVTKNPKRPFLVHAKGLTVKVLGTVFNVKAYTEDKKVETTLLKGKVQIELDNDPEQKIVLSPNEKLTVNDIKPAANLPSGTKLKTEAKVKFLLTTLQTMSTGEYAESAWINDKIVFTNDDFEDVAKQMERKYDVNIIFEDEALKKEQISGVLKNENLDDALMILKQITSCSYRSDKNNIYLFASGKNK